MPIKKGGLTLSGPRTVEMSALYYAAGPIGGTSRVRITVEPNKTNEFRVGFFESEVGGSGPMWRASGWMAAVIAAMLTGLDPATAQVSFDVSGRIDGPSAGALMTVGVLAAMRDDNLRQDITMTGTINPDGTIGPVGGIPHKIEGAAQAGKKIVLVPSGQRFDRELRQNQMVDLIDYGRRLGVEVREVPDIYTAYEILTGSKLPRSRAAERPEVTGKTFDRMQAKAKEWYARYLEARGQFNSLPEGIKGYLQGLMALAEEAGKRVNQLLNQGLVAGAYGQAQEAAIYATIAAQTGRTIEIYLTQGMQGAIEQLRASASAETKVTAMADRLKSEQPKTMSDVNALIASYSSLVEAIGFTSIADNILSRKIQSDQQALETIFMASIFYRAAELSIEAAKDVWDVGSGLGGRAVNPDVQLEIIADFFRRAAEANLNLFESVVIDEQVAKPRGMSLDVAKGAFMGADLSYSLARSSVDILPGLDRYFGGGTATSYAKLGGAMNAYSYSTSLIAKYYSLEAELDDNLEVKSIAREKALLNMLDLADDQLRQSIAALRSNEVDPALFVVVYESARLNREGSPKDKLEALTSFWAAYVQSRVMAYLGGFAGQ
jgi:hypothetical protein